MDTEASSVGMEMPRGTGYAIGIAIGMGTWIVWAIVFDNLLLGFVFAMAMGVLVFGPMFEKTNAGEVAPEMTRTVRNLLILGTLIGVAFIVVLLFRLALMA